MHVDDNHTYTHEHDTLTGASKTPEDFGTSVNHSPTSSVVQHPHLDHAGDSEPIGRPIPPSRMCCGSAISPRVREHDSGATRRDDSGFRRDQGGTNILPSRGNGHQVCDLVRQPMGEGESSISPCLPSIHQDVRGGFRDESPGGQVQGQSKGQELNSTAGRASNPIIGRGGDDGTRINLGSGGETVRARHPSHSVSMILTQISELSGFLMTQQPKAAQ